MTHWYEWVSWVANIVLVLVGVGGIWVAICTLRRIERQTKAGEDAAKAALEQANHTVTSERAWLTIRSSMDRFIPDGKELSYWWIIRNTGKTPARLIESQCAYQIVTDTDVAALPPSPKNEQPIILNGRLLPPGDSVDFSIFLTSATDGHIIKPGELDEGVMQQLVIGSFHLRAYGFVAYLDIFGERHESRFCDHYVWPLGTRSPRATGFRPLLGIPAEYTEHT